MRIFLTGGTGYIGSAVAAELRKRGHDLAALVRPESDAGALRDVGAAIIAGDLDSLPSLQTTLAAYDGFIHAAMAHGRDAVKLDKTAIEIFAPLPGFFLYTSGVWILGDIGGRVVDETMPPNPIPLVTWRVPHEELVLAKGSSAVLRPGCVYGGRQSLLASWFAAADQNQPLKIVGDGTNRWAMVNIHDVAECYANIVEQRASGILHAVDGTRATLNECARAAAPSGRIEHTTAKGPLVDALLLDQQISSERTRRQLGWAPRRTFLNSVEEQWREWRAAITPAAVR